MDIRERLHLPIDCLRDRPGAMTDPDDERTPGRVQVLVPVTVDYPAAIGPLRDGEIGPAVKERGHLGTARPDRPMGAARYSRG